MTSAVGIDIGSNTFSVTKLRQDDHVIDIVQDESFSVRLSEGMPSSRALKPQAVYRGLEALERIAEDFDIKNCSARAVGTAVLRMASNKKFFLDTARDILGFEIDVISGRREALLVGRGSRLGIEIEGPSIAVDIGGQSTEVIQVGLENPPEPLSLPLGVVELSERFFSTDPPRSEDVRSLRRHVIDVLRRTTPQTWHGTFIGVAGTATTLAAIDLELNAWRRERVHGYTMSRQKVDSWQNRILSTKIEQRISEYNVRASRADIFPAGLIVLGALMDHFGALELTISASGLRVGVALELLEELKCNSD